MEFKKVKIYSIDGLTDNDMTKLRRTLRKVYTEMPNIDEDYNFLVEFLTKLDNIVIKN
jgi:hypothetical protein